MSDAKMPSRTTSSASLSTTTSRSHHDPSTNSSSTASTMRPRNRKYLSPDLTPSSGGSGLLSQIDDLSISKRSQSEGRSVANNRDSNASIGQFFNESWNSSWASLQGLTNSIIAGDGVSGGSSTKSKPSFRRGPSQSSQRSKLGQNKSKAWGPAPSQGTPGLNDVASGSLAGRDSALRAAKTASLLESHDGVNGGLDITGKHKRRVSDDFSRHHREEPEDFLAYIHQVQPHDSHVGIVLRYKCGEDVLKKANGLWSRDSIQTRKWLTIPVDACEVRGAPCDAPAILNGGKVDLLAATPATALKTDGEDYFSREGEESKQTKPESEGKPWVHVKWVKIDGFAEPVEIGRVSRLTTGYFPPRRRKSLRSTSSVSSPRLSVDASSGVTRGSADGGPSSRRMSASNNRPQIPGSPSSARSRGDSEGNDGRPVWMRRPGGVGSMGRKARTPGPGNDYLNTWTRKHIPGLNIDAPSMSIMGSEVARWGFSKSSTDIAEPSYGEGRDTNAMPNRQGISLDKAAAAVETWLRGALSKRPSTPVLRAITRTGAPRPEGGGDLIELAHTGTDDGKFMLDQPNTAASVPAASPLQSLPVGSSSRSAVTGASTRRPGGAGKGFRDRKED